MFTTVEGEAYKGRWVAGDEVGCDEDGRVTDRKYTESVQSEVHANGQGVISNYEKLAKSTPQPLGLSLSDITLKASNWFGMTADGVLKTVQALYEIHKLCSYPRSDCSFLPESQFTDAPAIVEAVGATLPELAGMAINADTSIKSRVWNDKKVTANHAIVPTMKAGNYGALSDHEKAFMTLLRGII